MEYKDPYIEFCLENRQSLFRSLSNKEKELLAQNHTLVHCKKGDKLATTGSKPQGLICLAAGKVKIYKEGVGGREQILRLVKPAGLIGYPAIFADSTYYASAAAIEDSTAVIFDRSTVLRIIRKNSEVTQKMMKLLASEICYSNNRTVSLTQKHVRGRIAESLLVLRDTYGYEEDGKTINVYLSREDIAGLSNMTTSNAIRTLSHLASEKVIALEGKRIRIVDSCRLQRISEIG
jgi:CRP-like cAMP-binding protein